MMTTVLTDEGTFDVATSDELRVTAADAERLTGWKLEPRGMCKGAVCVPFAGSGAGVDLAAFWHHLGNPLLADRGGEIWVLGAGADERNASLAGLEAPDITLPDLAGAPHTLSSLRGNKGLLTTWASW